MSHILGPDDLRSIRRHKKQFRTFRFEEFYQIHIKETLVLHGGVISIMKGNFSGGWELVFERTFPDQTTNRTYSHSYHLSSRSLVTFFKHRYQFANLKKLLIERTRKVPDLKVTLRGVELK